MPVSSHPAAPGRLESCYDEPNWGEDESDSDGDVPPEPEADGDGDGLAVTVADQLTCTAWLVTGEAAGSAADTGLTGFQ
jgi:hypothetical protein